MNAKCQRVPTQFAPETRFEVPTVPFRASQETELERLKNRLLQELLRDTPDAELNAPLRRAANDAASLVWATPYPLLLLPALLDEKARAARLQTTHQAHILARSQVLLAGAA